MAFSFRLALLLSAIAFTPIAFAQNDRDFSGRWILRPELCEIQSLPEPPDASLKIDQQSFTIHVFRILAGSPPEEIRTYYTDGKESRKRSGSNSLSSVTKWEGSALLINTNVSSPGSSYSVSDRWKLSANGKQLTVRRQVSRQGSASESTLVYAREGGTPPDFLTRGDPRPSSSAPAAPASREHPTAAVGAGAPPEAAALRPEAASTPPSVAVAQTTFVVPQGTKIPLRLINSVNTKHSAPGDKVYLQTAYPVLSHGKVVIPPGSYVTGSLDEVKRAGRVKGKSEMFIRFDSLTLPNGTTRDFRSRMSGMDGNGTGNLDRSEGKVQGESGKGSDTKTVAGATAAGTSIGVLAGSAAGHLGMGAGIGAAAGALGGLAAVLASRGPDAILERGSTVEMVLDRDLVFQPAEIAR